MALTVVPLCALSVLGVQRVRGDRQLAAERAEVAESVELRGVIAEILPLAQLERFALEGMTRIDGLGVPRDLVVAFTGIDLEQTYVPNAEMLDGALDELQQGYRELRLDDGRILSEEIAAARRVIGLQRAAVEQRAGTEDGIRETFDGLDDLLDAAIASAANDRADDATLTQRQVQIELLGDVLDSANDYGLSIVAGLVYRTTEVNDATVRSLAVHEVALDRMQAALSGEPAAQLAEVRAHLLRFDLPPVEDDDAAARALDPTTVQQSAAIALGHLDYLGELKEFSNSFHAAIADELVGEAEQAHHDANRTTWILIGIGVLTVLLAIAVVWSLVVPIRRLTSRAQALSKGDLDMSPLRERGPSDLRTLTRTMNETLETLHSVEAEITRLADGRDTADGLDLPGDIGESIRRSFGRLASMTAALHQSKQLSSAIVSDAADAIWTTDEAGAILSANAAAERLVDAAAGQQIGSPIIDYLERTVGECRVTASDGTQRTVLVTSSPVDSPDGILNVVIAHDISERAEFEERLAFQAHHDALTGLPNRFAVLDHLETELLGSDTIAVLFIDLDGFKAVNDAEGHASGDQVLADVAETLRAATRGDEFVGRLGGDEFVIVTSRFAQIADVTALGYRLIREIEQPRVFGDRMFVLSASVGVALVEPGTPGLDAIRRADNALYQAKRVGRGQVGVYDESMQQQIEQETELEMALRQAVRNDELILHLQPLIDLPDGAMSGVECLVRWDRPGHGIVPPGDFIPIAERSTIIDEIERWVLHQACQLAATWREREPGCQHRIAVNISGRHLIEGDLLSDVDAALALTGADPTMLELELTESQLLEDLDRATEVLDRLREQGIHIAVDDFGTGYSSMTYLRSLPIDSIKIDRSFVARATEHGYDSTVVEALLTIGRTLGLSVVAEGIETDEQLSYVRARGCHRAQGFLLARPMPVDEAEALLFDHERATSSSEA